MRCLTEVELQAVADGEAPDALANHVATCAVCRDRVDDIRKLVASFAAAVHESGDMPAPAQARVGRAIASGEPVRGATALRGPMPAPAWRRAGVLSALAAVAVVAVIVFVGLPRIGDPTTLSAEEVLGRSLDAMSVSNGTELLDYELVVDGPTAGSWRIEQVIDHDVPTRFRISAYDADGVLEAAFSQDPATQRREQLVRVDGRNYIVSVGAVSSPVLSMPQMARALMETAVTMMQVTADQKLTTVDGPDGLDYVIEVPAVTASPGAATPLDLHRARVVVAGSDFHIRELDAAGTLLRQPFSVSFKLLRRAVRPPGDVAAAEFEIPRRMDDVVLEGTAEAEPVRELVTTIVRELASARGR
jgi:hypothetical protein